MDSGDDLAMMSHKEVMQTRISEAWERLISMWLKFGYEKDQYERRQKAVVKHVSVSYWQGSAYFFRDRCM